MNIQRLVLTAKTLSSYKVQKIIDFAEFGLRIFDELDPTEKNVRMINKIRYNLIDLYTKNIMTDFDKADSEFSRFLEMKKDADLSQFVAADVSAAFKKLAAIVHVSNT